MAVGKPYHTKNPAILLHTPANNIAGVTGKDSGSFVLGMVFYRHTIVKWNTLQRI